MRLIAAAESCATATSDCHDTVSGATDLLPPVLLAVIVVVVLVVVLTLIVLRRHRR
jgi:hypothetical protein